MLKKYSGFLIACFLLANSYKVFAVSTLSPINMDVGKVELHTNFNGNENLIKIENSMSVNYFTKKYYNVLFAELKKDQIIDVPVGKYELDYIEFLESYELKLRLDAPKEFEVKKNETTKLNFEIVKDPNQTPNPIKEKAKEMEKKRAAEMKKENVTDKNATKTDNNTTETDKNITETDNKNMTENVDKKDNKKGKFHLDYLTIILLISLVIALVVLKKKSGIKVK
jgi:hypothetical protein